jgi:hypothetical protein
MLTTTHIAMLQLNINDEHKTILPKEEAQKFAMAEEK